MGRPAHNLPPMRVELLYEIDPHLGDARARGEGAASLDLDARGRIVIGAGTWAGVIRSETREVVQSFAGIGARRRTSGHVTFSPDGRHAISFCGGDEEPAIHVWDVEDGSEVDRWEAPEAGPLSCVSPDRRFAVTERRPARGVESLFVWDLATGTVAHRIAIAPGRFIVVDAVAFLEENTLAWACSDEAEPGITICDLRDEFRVAANTACASLAIARLGRSVLSTGADGHIRRFDRGPLLVPERDENGRLRTFGHEEELTAGREYRAPDPEGFGAAIAAGRADGAAFALFAPRRPGWLVRAADGATLAFATARDVTDALFSPDGTRLFAVGGNGLLRAWSVVLEDRRPAFPL